MKHRNGLTFAKQSVHNYESFNSFPVRGQELCGKSSEISKFQFWDMQDIINTS